VAEARDNISIFKYLYWTCFSYIKMRCEAGFVSELKEKGIKKKFPLIIRNSSWRNFFPPT
jgi:hypothetical protein